MTEIANRQLLEMTTAHFVAFLRRHEIDRCYFVWDDDAGAVRASHGVLQPIAEGLAADTRDYDRHEGVFLQVDDAGASLMGAFVHRTCRGQGQGGMRFWAYETLGDFLHDGLRLAVGMTHKNALAGLWWGGGKGVIARDPDTDYSDPIRRRELMRNYGRFVTSLRGCYVAAEDIGIDPRDVADIYSQTRFVTCIPETIGGSGNPSPATAEGVVQGMEAALAFLDDTLEGARIVIEGLGHVGEAMVGMLLERGVASIVGTDIDCCVTEAVERRIDDARLEVRTAPRGDHSALTEPCDIVSPCATGGAITPTIVEAMRCRVVCGAANNQLEDAARDDELLMARGIVYVPDFLVNRMGIVNCANEQYGALPDDPAIRRHLDPKEEGSVYRTTLRVLENARDSKTPPGKAATTLAETMSMTPHPIFGHRGQAIVRSLVNEGWEKND